MVDIRNNAERQEYETNTTRLLVYFRLLLNINKIINAVKFLHISILDIAITITPKRDYLDNWGCNSSIMISFVVCD